MYLDFCMGDSFQLFVFHIKTSDVESIKLSDCSVRQHPQAVYTSIGNLVPFVDGLNTLMNSRLVYTKADRTELGNPTASKQVFGYVLNHSPYDNIVKRWYPDMYAAAAMDGPWEVAKWIAKIEKHNMRSGSNIILSIR
ncbi:hypothetical protein [Alteromonas sp. ASW11-130]|uniref:hypothetical protein n=1 Tax=Alteromonas sp. ASW11-130 TaxID=3015775 RepID=UPI002242A742|nr:hypothetical protein [Alteromonas sp. ASW11-130]MCW8092485.1 hypothetical protein [Alteromonas sp. ASW11-130]